MRCFPFFKSSFSSQLSHHFLTGKSLLLIGMIVAFLPNGARAQDKAGTLLKKQREKALANWKRGTRSKKATIFESKHLILCASTSKEKLQAASQALDKQFETASKALKLEKKDRWQGKLAVFMLEKERAYKFFIIRVEVRKVVAGERASATARGDYPRAIIGPSDKKGDLSILEQAGAQIAIALLRRKNPRGVPMWLENGFGRATVLRTTSRRRRAQERLRVLALIRTKKRQAAHAWSTTIPRQEAQLLAGSIIEFFAYSGLTKKFLPFLERFRPAANGSLLSAEAVLKLESISPKTLDQAWKTWLARQR